MCGLRPSSECDLHTLGSTADASAGGRHSNGPIWTELVAANLSIPLYSYGIGGATTSSKLVQGYTWNGTLVPVPGTYEQITQFLTSPPPIDIASTLFVVVGGANDVIQQPNNTGGVSAALLHNGVRRLQAVGATNYLFLNYPDLSLIPWDEYLPSTNKTVLRTYSDDLSSALDFLATEVDGYYVDLAPIFYDFYYYGQPTVYGFDKFGAYGSCVVGVYGEAPNVTICDNPDEWVFWDMYHPSARSHQWIAKAALQELSQ